MVSALLVSIMKAVESGAQCTKALGSNIPISMLYHFICSCFPAADPGFRPALPLWRLGVSQPAACRSSHTDQIAQQINCLILQLTVLLNKASPSGVRPPIFFLFLLKYELFTNFQYMYRQISAFKVAVSLFSCVTYFSPSF